MFTMLLSVVLSAGPTQDEIDAAVKAGVVARSESVKSQILGQRELLVKIRAGKASIRVDKKAVPKSAQLKHVNEKIAELEKELKAIESSRHFPDLKKGDEVKVRDIGRLGSSGRILEIVDKTTLVIAVEFFRPGFSIANGLGGTTRVPDQRSTDLYYLAGVDTSDLSEGKPLPAELQRQPYFVGEKRDTRIRGKLERIYVLEPLPE